MLEQAQRRIIDVESSVLPKLAFQAQAERHLICNTMRPRERARECAQPATAFYRLIPGARIVATCKTAVHQSPLTAKQAAPHPPSLSAFHGTAVKLRRRRSLRLTCQRVAILLYAGSRNIVPLMLDFESLYAHAGGSTACKQIVQMPAFPCPYIRLAAMA
eukprot:3497917-Pleurochrysis_carterae.AAC.1